MTLNDASKNRERGPGHAWKTLLSPPGSPVNLSRAQGEEVTLAALAVLCATVTNAVPKISISV